MRHLYNRLEPTKLMCRLICNLPELNIRILIRLLPILIFVWISDHKLASLTVGSDTLCCRISYPTEH